MDTGDVGCISSYTSPALSRNGKLIDSFWGQRASPITRLNL